jgi:hypothetical protein
MGKKIFDLQSCKKCLLHKEILVNNVDEDDIDVFTKIINGINTNKVAINPDIILDNLSNDEIKSFVENNLNNRKYYKNLEIEWWKTMISKYGITENTKIDTNAKIFYHCLNDKGIEEINFKNKDS